MPNLETYLLKSAPQFNVNCWSDYPEINGPVAEFYKEILSLRKGRGERVREPEKLRKYIKVLVLDLWAARKLSLNPYRAISLNKSDYRKGGRYRKIHLKYDRLVGVLDDLIFLGYIYLVPGFKYHTGPKKGYRSRIKATDDLIEDIESERHDFFQTSGKRGFISTVTTLTEDPENGGSLQPETIVLRDADDRNVDYEDTPKIVQMREKLARINKKIASANLALRITDEQFEALEKKCLEDRRRTIDFTRNQLHRVFNNSSWDAGGRFYGAWWQELPREHRKYIEINHRDTVELDYSGHHIRILYAQAGLSPPNEPYDLEEFPREDQKRAILVVLNASERKAAIGAIRAKGIKNAKSLAQAMEDRHSEISEYFYKGVGMRLMKEDSVVAEEIMLKMIDRGATVLPIHDSFIVRASYKEELEEVMSEVFSRRFEKSAAIKPKRTVIEESSSKKAPPDEGQLLRFVSFEKVLIDRKKYRKFFELFGPQ